MTANRDALALALAELKSPTNPWAGRALKQYPLKRGVRQKPLSVSVRGRHRFYFQTVDPDVFWEVIVSNNSTEVRAHLSPAIHAELLVTSDAISQLEIADRLGRPSDNLFCCDSGHCDSGHDAGCEVVNLGVWNLTSKLSYPGEAEEHIEDILRQLKSGDRALSRLIKKKHASAHLCLVMKEVPGSDLVWVVNPTTLLRLGKIGVRLNFQRALASTAD